MNIDQIEEAVLEHVLAPGYQPTKPKIIAKRLALEGEDVAVLRRVIRRLIRSGRLEYGERHIIFPGDASASKAPSGSSPAHSPGAGVMLGAGSGLPPETAPLPPEEDESDEELSAEEEVFEDEPRPKRKQKEKPLRQTDALTGTFRRVASGAGYVRLPGPRDETKKSDIYVPPRYTLDAASGDTVLVRPTGEVTPREQRVARVVKVVERQRGQFVGTYFVRGDQSYVKVDGKVFTDPIQVGDPGAKAVTTGDKVVFEMVRYPTHQRAGEGVIVEILGPRGKPGVDTLLVIKEFNFPVAFADDALAEARAHAEAFEKAQDAPLPANRTDLTQDVIITIDPATARDFDDAVSLTRDADGHWRLGVHIADVSFFVPEGGALDREAKERATSVYLPDRVLPMIPELISNGLASLQPNRVRYARTVFIDYAPDGSVTGREWKRSAIKSRHRFNYDEVDEFLADPEAFRERCAPEVFDLLGRMRDLARMLRKRRRERGALELSMPEVKVDLGPDGKVKGAHVEKDTESHQMIEEFMLAANEAVATKLNDLEIFFLRRVHTPPSPRKMKVLTEFVRELGFDVDNLQDRFELQHLLETSAKLPQAPALHFAVLRSLQRAYYGPETEGHYALAIEHYCHFTSPIRRYPDLTVHRLMDAVLDKRPPVNDVVAVSVLGEHCSQRERTAEEAERTLTKIKLLDYLSTKIGWEFDAIITGVEDFGLFAQGIELPAEGFLHISALGDEVFDFERASHSITGRRSGRMFRLGDSLRVQVARVDVDARELDLRLIAKLQSAAAPPTERGRSKGKKKPFSKAGPKPRKGFRQYSERDSKPGGLASGPQKKKRQTRKEKKKRRGR